MTSDTYKFMKFYIETNDKNKAVLKKTFVSWPVEFVSGITSNCCSTVMFPLLSSVETRPWYM